MAVRSEDGSSSFDTSATQQSVPASAEAKFSAVPKAATSDGADREHGAACDVAPGLKPNFRMNCIPCSVSVGLRRSGGDIERNPFRPLRLAARQAPQDATAGEVLRRPENRARRSGRGAKIRRAEHEHRKEMRADRCLDRSTVPTPAMRGSNCCLSHGGAARAKQIGPYVRTQPGQQAELRRALEKAEEKPPAVCDAGNLNPKEGRSARRRSFLPNAQNLRSFVSRRPSRKSASRIGAGRKSGEPYRFPLGLDPAARTDVRAQTHD